MSFILLHLYAPMQSWGSRSKFEYRDTEREPTFSGVIGLIAAAKGVDRTEDISGLMDLKMTIRVDQEGVVQQEFQTAQQVPTSSGKKEDQLIRRDYLSDAEFHVAIEGDLEQLKRIYEALNKPVYPLFLGRKSYVPALPVVYPKGQSLFVTQKSPLEFLSTSIPVRSMNVYPAATLCLDKDESEIRRIRFVVQDDQKSGEMRNDIPSSFHIYDREYKPRYIKNIFCEVRVGKNQEIYK